MRRGSKPKSEHAVNQLQVFTKRLHNRIRKEMKAIPPGPDSGVDHHTVQSAAAAAVAATQTQQQQTQSASSGAKTTEVSSSEYFISPLIDLVFEYTRPHTLEEAHKLADSAKTAVSDVQSDLDRKYRSEVARGVPDSWTCDKCHHNITNKAGTTTIKDRVSYLTLVCPDCKKETIWMRPPRADPTTVLGAKRTFAGCASFMSQTKSDTCLCGGAESTDFTSSAADDDEPPTATAASAAAAAAGVAGGGGGGDHRYSCGVCGHTLAGHFAGIAIDSSDWRWYYMFGGNHSEDVGDRMHKRAPRVVPTGPSAPAGVVPVTGPMPVFVQPTPGAAPVVVTSAAPQNENDFISHPDL